VDKKYLTTTEAARLLSVSADTVLKWVRAGKIQSYRTPGGHFRIPSEAVTTMLPETAAVPIPTATALTKAPFQFCWEFNSPSGDISPECKKCIVYQGRARRCYEFRDVPEEFGHLKLYCQSSCEDCRYFQVVKEQGLNILIVTRSQATMERLGAAARNENVHLRFACTEYDTAAAVERFRPDYVVVDCGIGLRRTNDLCRHLGDDDRIPITRLIISSKDPSAKDHCEQEILGWLRKPFTLDDLTGFIEQLQQSPVH
jgi:excisionase family DNA binding protein